MDKGKDLSVCCANCIYFKEIAQRTPYSMHCGWCMKHVKPNGTWNSIVGSEWFNLDCKDFEKKKKKQRYKRHIG